MIFLDCIFFYYTEKLEYLKDRLFSQYFKKVKLFDFYNMVLLNKLRGEKFSKTKTTKILSFLS